MSKKAERLEDKRQAAAVAKRAVRLNPPFPFRVAFVDPAFFGVTAGIKAARQ